MLKYIVILLILVTLLFGFTACGGTTSTTSTTTTSTTTTTTSTETTTTGPSGVPQYRPIEVVGVVGPITPVNPGGPTVQITLKNGAQEPLVALKATLQLQQPYEFDFDVSQSSPLAPGADASKTQTLINGYISSDASYPLEITATTQSGSVFHYTVQVTIGTPPPTY